MLMMSKTDLSSDELDTLRRSRNPTVVLTANGEVHTNEEAQVFVYDRNPFVTMQFLEETPAVLSLGKLCEDHGYSCEWVSGQKARLTNFVPLVVPWIVVKILVRVRPLHRHRRTRQVHLQVQLKSEVTN